MQCRVALLLLSRCFFLYSFVAMLFSILALSFGQYEFAFPFFLVTLITLAFAALVSIHSPKIQKTLTIKDLTTSILVIWFAIVTVSCIPFLIYSEKGLHIVLFKTVAHLTTTGDKSAFGDTNTPSGVWIETLWRCWLHIFGASLTLTGGLSVFSILKLPFLRLISASFLNTTSNQTLYSVSRNFLTVLVVLCLVVIVFWLICLASGVPAVAAISAATSAITTGYVSNVGSVLEFTALSKTVLIAALFLGCTAFFPVVLNWRKAGEWISNKETKLFIALSAVFIALIVISDPGYTFVELIAVGLSILSTSGMFVDSSSLLSIGIPVVVLGSFVGGAAISTSSGAKLFRIGELLRQTFFEIDKLANPSVITRQNATRRLFQSTLWLTVWVYIIGFVLSSLLLTAYFCGIGFELGESVLIGVGTLSNSSIMQTDNLLIALAEQPMVGIVLSIGMLLGRLELFLLAAFVLRS